VASPSKSNLQRRINELMEYARSQGYRSDEVVAIIQSQI